MVRRRVPGKHLPSISLTLWEHPEYLSAMARFQRYAVDRGALLWPLQETCSPTHKRDQGVAPAVKYRLAEPISRGATEINRPAAIGVAT